jgi:hypothetical protein
MRLAETVTEEKGILSEKVHETVHERISEIETESRKIYGGLCSTCENSPTCTFRRDSRRPVMQCDEFAPSPPRVTTLTVRGATMYMESVKDETVKGASNVKTRGLCETCKNLKTCTYSKSEAGIWFCDEYE